MHSSRMLGAARSATVAVMLALGVMAPGAAAATGTVTDPAGDQCPAGRTVDCGSDLLSTSWTSHPDASVTLTVSRAEASCHGNVETFGPTFFLQAPDGTVIGAAGEDVGGRWAIDNAGFDLPLNPTSRTIVGGVETTTVVLSEADRVGYRDFDYFITNSCVGANVSNPFFGIGAPSDTLPNGGNFGAGAASVKVRLPPEAPPPAPGPVVTTGTVRDPAGDNCVFVPAACGPDLRSTTWATHPDGSVTISVSRVPKVCTNLGFAGPFAGEAAFVLLELNGSLGHLGGPRGGELWSFGVARGSPVFRATDTVVGGVRTSTLRLTAADLFPAHDFHYFIVDGCGRDATVAGSSDTIPNGAGQAGAKVEVRFLTQALVASAVAKALASAKPTSAATLIKKGFPIAFVAPAAGTLKVTLGRTKTIRARGAAARAQARVLAVLTVKVTIAGAVRRSVKLTRAGRALLRKARNTNGLKLTVSFKAGALSASKSKTVRIKPARH